MFADELINKLLNSDTYKEYDKIYKVLIFKLFNIKT